MAPIEIQSPLAPAIRRGLEELPADMRSELGWRQLFVSVIDAVIASRSDQVTGSSRKLVLLTLTTYCYAANILGSDDVAAACLEQRDVAYVVRGWTFTAGDIRQFRRHQKPQIESCLKCLYNNILNPSAQPGTAEPANSSRMHPFSAEVVDLAQRRINLAILLDTAFCE